MVKIAGILNITPDSFSDGGLYAKTSDALAQVERMIDDGADIIDIGAESTRPGATAIDAEEESLRLQEILSEVISLAHSRGMQVSIDTYKPQIASLAIEAGVDIVNDVSGFTNPEMIKVVQKHSDTKLIAMHNLGVPSDRKVHLPEGSDVMAQILQWGITLLFNLEMNGIKRKNIILDPGLGFGKTAEQSWTIINNIEKLQKWGTEIYVGHSRKGFLSVTENKDACTLAVSLFLASQNVNYLRVHDVGLHTKLLAKITNVETHKKGRDVL